MVDSPAPHRILIVGPAWVGDMVMAQSLFKVLKQQQPNALIDVLAPSWTKPLLDRMPEVHAALLAPFKHGQLSLFARINLGRQLRQYHYDRAIILPRSLKSAIVPFVAKAKRRVGFLGEARVGLLNDIRQLDKKMLPRTVDRFVTLGLDATQTLSDPIPRPRLVCEQKSINSTLQKFNTIKSEKPILGLCPGAEYGPAKQWPAAHFAAVASAKLAAGWQVWLFGSDKDTAVTSRINALTDQQCLDLAGKTSLSEAIDLMSLVTAVVSNDSGLMHVAASLDKQVVAIYGSSDPGFTPPLSDKATILSLNLDCSPCFKRECPLGHLNCLQQLLPEQVIKHIYQAGQ